MNEPLRNITNTPPPDYVLINGKEYEARTDFRVWAEVMLTIQENLFDNPDTQEKQIENLETIIRVEKMIFGQVIPEPAPDAFEAIVEFMKGYPRVENEYSGTEDEDGTKLYSLRHDMNMIILAIRNQSGIDLTYSRTEPFHWWLFLLEFQTLNDDHLISQIMQLRAYNGKDEEMIKRMRRVSLPREYTRSEQAMLEELEELFPNT